MDHEHEHHHKRHVITKYIFSLDHKMIAKQIDNRYYGIIGVGMSDDATSIGHKNLFKII
jgi:cytochrome c oxidase subunit 1